MTIPVPGRPCGHSCVAQDDTPTHRIHLQDLFACGPLLPYPPPASAAAVSNAAWLSDVSTHQQAPFTRRRRAGLHWAGKHCAVSRTSARHIQVPKGWGRKDVLHVVRLRHASYSPCGSCWVSASVRAQSRAQSRPVRSKSVAREADVRSLLRSRGPWRRPSTSGRPRGAWHRGF